MKRIAPEQLERCLKKNEEITEVLNQNDEFAENH